LRGSDLKSEVTGVFIVLLLLELLGGLPLGLLGRGLLGCRLLARLSLLRESSLFKESVINMNIEELTERFARRLG
jgi:hypothetical protein